MTTRPQTDDVICLTSLSIHHYAGVDVSDSPTLVFSLAQASTSVTFSFQLSFITPDEPRLLFVEFADT